MFIFLQDKDGNILNPEEAEEFTNDLWDCGIPPSHEDLIKLWEKWSDRFDIPDPRKNH